MLKYNGFMERDSSFWLNRRVFMTGHTGLLGTWIASWLSALGADVAGFARRPAGAASLFSLAGLDGRLANVTGDVRDRARLAQTVGAVAPEIIVHLAGRRSAPACLKRPLDGFDTNVTGTLNLLHAARGATELRAIVVVGGPASPRRPAQAAGPDEPLGASLACAEIIAETFRQCYLQPADGIGLATLRLPELVGGGDFAPGRLVPDLVRAMAAGRLPAVDAALQPYPLLHVADAVAGCVALAEALVQRPAAFARCWTAPAAPPAAWSRAAIAAHLPGRPAGGSPKSADGSPPAEAPAAVTAALGWRPRLDVATALDWALEGYRRLEEEADGGFVLEQQRRLLALGGPAAGHLQAIPQQPTPPARASHVALSS